MLPNGDPLSGVLALIFSLIGLLVGTALFRRP